MTKYFYTKKDVNNQQLEIRASHFEGSYIVGVSKGMFKRDYDGQGFSTILFQDLNASFAVLKGRKSAKKLDLLNVYVENLYNHLESVASDINYESHTRIKDFFNNYILNNKLV